MFNWLTGRLRRDRPKLTDRELAEQEANRRRAEAELRRDEAKMAEQRAPLDAYSRANRVS
jgi:hypothetical protein